MHKILKNKTRFYFVFYFPQRCNNNFKIPSPSFIYSHPILINNNKILKILLIIDCNSSQTFRNHRST